MASQNSPVFVSEYFEGTYDPTQGTVYRNGDILSNLLDDHTGEYVTFRKVVNGEDGMPKDDSKVDGVMYVQLLNEYFRRVCTVISVKYYGAQGNGTANDTEAFDRAFSFLDKCGGGTLFVPAGIYLVEGLELPKKTNLVGEGLGSTTLKLIDETDKHCLIDTKYWYEGIIEEFTLDGNRSNQSSAIDGIFINRAANNTNSNYRNHIRRLYIKDFSGNGIHAVQETWVFTVQECSIRQCAQYGILNKSTDNGFNNNIIALCGWGGILNTGSNTRFFGGKILFNGQDSSESAGIEDRAARCSWVGIECQENFRHNFIFKGSYTTAFGLIADMANVARRTEVFGSSQWHDPDSIGYNFIIDCQRCQIYGASTSASMNADKRTSFAGLITDASANNQIGIIFQENQFGDLVNNRPERNLNTYFRDGYYIASLSDDSGNIAAEGKTSIIMPSLTSYGDSNTFLLPSANTRIPKVTIFNVNANENYKWNVDRPLRLPDQSEITEIPNQSALTIEAVANVWRVISLYKIGPNAAEPVQQVVGAVLKRNSNYTIVNNDFGTNGEVNMLVDASNAPVNIVLADATFSEGKKISIKKIDNSTNAVSYFGRTVGGVRQRVDGQTVNNVISNSYEHFSVISDGIEWFKI